LRGMENLSNLTYFDCSYQSTSLEAIEAIEILIKLIKNNKKMKYHISNNFINSNEHIELTNLFHALLKRENKDKIDEYIEEI
jgi:hypothetical protein